MPLTGKPPVAKKTKGEGQAPRLSIHPTFRDYFFSGDFSFSLGCASGGSSVFVIWPLAPL